MEYKCIENFTVPFIDDDGFPIYNKYIEIKKRKRLE